MSDIRRDELRAGLPVRRGCFGIDSRSESGERLLFNDMMLGELGRRGCVRRRVDECVLGVDEVKLTTRPES